ncbi:hypothetical protein BDAP_001573 [Binucleata daphniae]
MYFIYVIYYTGCNCLDSYPGFGFTGGTGKSKIADADVNPFLPNGDVKDNVLQPRLNLNYDELDPNYVARKDITDAFKNDNMISRGNFLTRPVPDSVKEKILEKSDDRDAMPFDFTQGFVSGPNDYMGTQSAENLMAMSEALGLKESFSKPKQPQALIMDVANPKNNAIVDMPAGSNYYPWNNPYLIVQSDSPIKTKKKDE